MIHCDSLKGVILLNRDTMINNDCMEHIMMFADGRTLANMMILSKNMHNLSDELMKFRRFQNDFIQAQKVYQSNLKKAYFKKRQLYKIVDIVVKNQHHWRMKHKLSVLHAPLCERISKNIKITTLQHRILCD